MSSTDAPSPHPDGPQGDPATRERGGAVASRIAAARSDPGIEPIEHALDLDLRDTVRK